MADTQSRAELFAHKLYQGARTGVPSNLGLYAVGADGDATFVRVEMFGQMLRDVTTRPLHVFMAKTEYPVSQNGTALSGRVEQQNRIAVNRRIDADERERIALAIELAQRALDAAAVMAEPTADAVRPPE